VNGIGRAPIVPRSGASARSFRARNRCDGGTPDLRGVALEEADTRDPRRGRIRDRETAALLETGVVRAFLEGKHVGFLRQSR
jgi:hypothetical protein